MGRATTLPENHYPFGFRRMMGQPFDTLLGDTWFGQGVFTS